MVSAVHHAGERLYAIARRGETVHALPAQGDDLRLEPPRLSLPASRACPLACSEGTYVRTLCEDLAAAMGCTGSHGGAVARCLGTVRAYEARTLEEIEASPQDCAHSAGAHHPVSDDRARRPRLGGFSSRAPRSFAAGLGGQARVRARLGASSSSASAKRSARCWRRAKFSCEGPPRTRSAKRLRVRSCSPSAFSMGCIAGTARSSAHLLRTRRPGFRAAVLTFRNHPATHLRPERTPPLITTLEERVNLLASTGIDELYLVPFDDRIATLRCARRFLSDVLVGMLGVRAARRRAKISGSGAVAAVTHRSRARCSEPLGVERHRGARRSAKTAEGISSTRIRAALARGDMATVNRLLGEPYALRGRVTFGAGRGHDLGFPTANLAMAARRKTLPADGVYACVARYDGRDYRGLLSIGTNPTFRRWPTDALKRGWSISGARSTARN